MLLNAGAALFIAGAAETVIDGIEQERDRPSIPVPRERCWRDWPRSRIGPRARRDECEESGSARGNRRRHSDAGCRLRARVSPTPRSSAARSSRAANGPVFTAALSRRDRVNIIAECKRRSPSRGVLRAAYDPVEIAVDYERAGAAAISVLTEPTFFDGALESPRDRATRRGRIPLLRKDFIVDEYQLLEARAAGADAALADRRRTRR